MDRTTALIGNAGILLTGLLLSTAIAHEAYMNTCVCVINSLARAAIALTVSMFFGILTTVPFKFFTERMQRPLQLLQVIAIVTGLFFIAQHILFVHELV